MGTGGARGRAVGGMPAQVMSQAVAGGQGEDAVGLRGGVELLMERSSFLRTQCGRERKGARAGSFTSDVFVRHSSCSEIASTYESKKIMKIESVHRNKEGKFNPCKHGLTSFFESKSCLDEKEAN